MRGLRFLEFAQPGMQKRFPQDAHFAIVCSVRWEVWIYAHNVQAIAASLQHLYLRLAANVDQVVIIAVEVVHARVDPDDVTVFELGAH